MNKTHGHGSTDFEVSGYLQKKTSKGLFMHRYFATKSHYLHYWTDKKSYENEEKPSETFDLCEITNMSRINSKQFILCFMSDKFKLELKAPSSELCVEWKEILAAKRALYSVNDLMTNLEIDHASFVTKTFQSLMILKERDQNEYIMERLDDIFLAAEDEAKSKMLRSDSFALVNAATVCFQELILTCEECNLEISQRNPRITAHCRLYIQRYAEIVKGRVTLELLYLPGIQQKKYELMGMPTICAAVKFMSVVSKIPSFSFVPHDIVPAIHSNLFTTGQLISALINISITKMDSLFVKLEEIALGQRNKVLELVDHTVSEVLSTIPMDTFDGENANLVYNKILTSQMLSYADHISLLTFANYDEKSLILHINTCDAMALKLHKTLFVLQPCESHKAMSNDKSTTVTITTIDADSGASEKSKHEKDDKIQDNISEHSKESNADARIIKRLQYPLAVVDAVSSAMFNSARNAALTMVYNTLHSADDLVSGFLNERVVEWKNGSLIVAFIDRFEKWVLNIAQIMPLKYLNLLYVETGRTMIYLYISNMIHFHKHAKVMLSAAGIERMDSDLSALYSWMTHSNATVREYSDGERNLLQTLKNFLLCDKDMALQAYAHAISSMGLQYSLHIYDLIRLIMKFRLDLPPKNRKSLLALCGEYLQQLQKAVANDPTLICGSSNQKRAFQDVSLFDRLCPKVGVEHCTGKKWRVEMLADLAAMRMTISLLVTQTCDEARAIRRAFMVLPDHNTQIVTAALTVSTRSENRNSEVDSEVDASHVEQKVSGIEESGSDRILEFQQRIDNLTLEEKPITGNDSKAVVANATNTVVNTKGKRKPPRPPPPPMQPMKNAVKQPVLVEKVSAVAKSDSVESVDTIKAAPPKPMKPPKPTKPSNVTIPQAVNISVGNSDFAESSVSPTNALRQLLEAANKEIMPGANSE